MWIVRVALQRPYTFIMLAVLIVLMGGYAILKTATDIFLIQSVYAAINARAAFAAPCTGPSAPMVTRLR